MANSVSSLRDPPGGVAAADDDRQRLIDKYDTRVPRYTSYPTALQFSAAVTPEVYAGWLGALPVARPVSLYVHVPFCRRLCWFCGCHTRVVNGAQPVSDYVGWLRQEAMLMEQALPAGVRANALQLGGGTPNMLSRDDLVDLFGALRRVFGLSPGAEIGAELDPDSLTAEWVRAAAHFGLTRASLGVQDLSPAVQAAINRREDFEVVARSVGWLREAAIGSINLDLMYGLPRQRVSDVVSTLEAVLRLKPERIALFGYAHVPWMKPHQKLIDAAELPGARERLEQSLTAAELLSREGYVRIGLDHFALPHDDMAVAAKSGRLRRTFQGYVVKSNETLIGLGASAISQMRDGFAQNQASELNWRAQLAKGVLPIARGLALTAEDRFRGEVIERLMCDLTVDLDAVRARHGRGPDDLASAMERLSDMRREGLVTVQGGQVAVTERGRPFVRAVCAAFDAYLEPSAGRHAPAI